MPAMSHAVSLTVLRTPGDLPFDDDVLGELDDWEDEDSELDDIE